MHECMFFAVFNNKTYFFLYGTVAADFFFDLTQECSFNSFSRIDTTAREFVEEMIRKVLNRNIAICVHENSSGTFTKFVLLSENLSIRKSKCLVAYFKK